MIAICKSWYKRLLPRIHIIMVECAIARPVDVDIDIIQVPILDRGSIENGMSTMAHVVVQRNAEEGKSYYITTQE